MALVDNELLASVSIPATKRFFPLANRVCKFGAVAGGPTLAIGTPVSYDRVNAVWRAWRKAVSEIVTITMVADGGTFTVSAGGQATAALAWNVSAANLKTALEGLEAIGPGNVDVALAALVYTITYKGRLTAKNASDLTTGVGSLTSGLGAGSATVATGTAAVDDDSHNIRGFVFPEAVVLSASGEVQGVVMTSGRFHVADVATPSGQDSAELLLALAGEDPPYSSLYGRGLHGEGSATIR